MNQNSVLIVGSIALDSIETPYDKKTDVVGDRLHTALLSLVGFQKPRLLEL